MSLTNNITEARRRHDIAEVLGTKRKTLVCPLPMHNHTHNTPSFSVFWKRGYQWWKCHGNCSAEGDVIDLVGYLRIPGYDPKNHDHLREALTLLDSRYEIKLVLPELDNFLNGDEWLDFLPPGPEAVAYAASRGITPEGMKHFQIGQSGNWMTIPCFEEQRLTGVKLRNIGTGLRYRSLKGSRQGLFNFDAVNLAQEPVLMLKAEIPVVIATQEGLLACAPTGGEGGWREHWRTALALASVIVVGDNDEPGRKLGERRTALVNGKLRFPPDSFKDWDEFFLADKEACLRKTRQWIEEAR